MTQAPRLLVFAAVSKAKEAVPEPPKRLDASSIKDARELHNPQYTAPALLRPAGCAWVYPWRMSSKIDAHVALALQCRRRVMRHRRPSRPLIRVRPIGCSDHFWHVLEKAQQVASEEGKVMNACIRSHDMPNA